MIIKVDSRILTIQLVFALSAFVLLLKAAQIQLFDPSFRIRADATAIEKPIIPLTPRWIRPSFAIF